MFTLRRKHTVRDFRVWMQAFDRDVVGRGAPGVRSYKSNTRTAPNESVQFDGLGMHPACIDHFEVVWNLYGTTVISVQNTTTTREQLRDTAGAALAGSRAG